jgi:hypothetical protein
VQFLSIASVFCGLLALYTIIPALLGIPLGIAARYMSTSDLAKMHTGLMDPAGARQTELASKDACVGIVLNVIVLLLMPLLFAYILGVRW